MRKDQNSLLTKLHFSISQHHSPSEAVEDLQRHRRQSDGQEVCSSSCINTSVCLTADLSSAYLCVSVWLDVARPRASRPDKQPLGRENCLVQLQRWKLHEIKRADR